MEQFDIPHLVDFLPGETTREVPFSAPVYFTLTGLGYIMSA